MYQIFGVKGLLHYLVRVEGGVRYSTVSQNKEKEERRRGIQACVSPHCQSRHPTQRVQEGVEPIGGGGGKAGLGGRARGGGVGVGG